MKFINTLAVAVSAAGHASAEYVRCGTSNPSAAHMAVLNAAAVNSSSSSNTFSIQATRNIHTYVHVVTSSSTQKASYPQSMINQQISVMNQEYAPLSVSFSLQSTDYTVNKAWAAAEPESQTEYDMKKALRQGTYGDLNLYFLSDLGGGLLGLCYFPVSKPTADDLVLDGCLCLASSMPGSTATNYNEGYTAVHEVGHWFGLYHVFQGSACSGSGDYVSDTPIQKTATSGCPSSQDSCPSVSGVDSIHNFMDYSYDSCMTEFSKGQVTRGANMYDTLRLGK